MADRRDGIIHIGQLNLRMPGKSAEAAHRVAGGIGDRLGEKLPARLGRRLGALSIRVPISGGMTEAEMSDAVTEAIIGALRNGS